MKKLTELTALEGKTIRAVFDEHQGNGLVIVFEDDDWCVLSIENELTQDEAVSINRFSFGEYDHDIKNFLSPKDLLQAQLLSQAQYDYLIKQNRKHRADTMRRQAQDLISKANQLLTA